MNMHDNDIDKLFRSKLNDFEVEPSANVWAGISTELGNAPKRKSIVPMLRIAAGIAVIISAGLFFLPKKQVVIESTKGPKLAINRGTKPAAVHSTQLQVPVQTPAVNVNPQVRQMASVPAVKHNMVAVNNTTVQTPANGGVPQQPMVDPVKIDPAVNTQTIANVTTNSNTNKAVVPDPTTPIVDHPTDNAPIFNTAKPAVVIAALPANDDNKQEPAKKRRFSLGKVLNAVVGAVDKRQDKLIEFADSDEGETITGINIGILKVKKVE